MAKTGKLSMDNDIPQVLLIPSGQSAFAKQIDQTICINPGQVLKFDKLGTYALLTIYDDKSCKVLNKTRVDIRQL